MEIALLLTVVILLVLSISRWKLHPFLALLVFALLYALGCGMDPVESVSLLMEGFAKTLQWIAVIMIFGAMIGEIANETGGAERIAHSTLKLAGEKRLPPAGGTWEKTVGPALAVPLGEKPHRLCAGVARIDSNTQVGQHG